MAYPYTPPVSHRFITARIDDISEADQVYVVPGFRGRIRNISSVIEGAITSVDAVLTAKIGGTAVTGGVITVAYSGSAAGTVDSCTPTAARTFTASDAIEVETNGGSSGARQVMITIECEPT